MKTHELASCLELAARILQKLPDGEIHETLERILELARKSKAADDGRAPSEAGAVTISQDLIERIPTMSTPQIEELLHSKEFASIARVREIAERLGVTTSRRQNHAALVNMVVKHIESQRMDSIIRGSQATEDIHKRK